MQVSSISNFMIYSPWVSQAAGIIKTTKDEFEKAADKTTQVSDMLDTKALTENDETKKTSNKKQDVSSLPWTSLMHQLNLTPTGDIQKDYNTTVSRLEELIRYTRNPQKLQEYLDLADKVSVAFTNVPRSLKPGNTSSLSGSEQIAQYNRVMMLNMKSYS